jgi:hypothetical protein
MQRVQDGAGVAVKFFFSAEAYEREVRYYQEPVLRQILVPVVFYDDNRVGSVCSSDGYVFPPFIVVERGEVCVFPCFTTFTSFTAFTQK